MDDKTSNSKLNEGKQIRARPATVCMACGCPGQLHYENLADRLYSASGKWNLRKCTNQECGLFWLDPMPLEKEIHKAYLEYYTHGSDTNIANQDNFVGRTIGHIRKGYWAQKYNYSVESVPRWERMLSFMAYLLPCRRPNLDFNVKYLPANPGGRLLEVGCGSGDSLKTMQDLGWQAEGVEVDNAATAHARSIGMNVHSGILEEQDYPEGYFDAIVINHVIEHVHDIRSLLIKCYEILKPGGRLVIVTPNIESWGHRIYQSAWLHLDAPRHLFIFSPNSLQTLASEAGFNISNIKTVCRGPSEVFLAGRTLKHMRNYQLGSHGNGIDRLRTIVMQSIEWAMLKLKPMIGEEIVLLAYK